MADQILHGIALSIRDIPNRGMLIRLAAPATTALEPAEAAQLGQTLIALAEDAMQAETVKRRGL